MRVWTACLLLIGMAAATVWVVTAGGQSPMSPGLVPEQPRVVEGTIAGITSAAPAPMVHVQTGDGQRVNILVDPRETAVLYGGQLGRLDQLVVGHAVKVYYVEPHGRPAATSIVVQQPLVTFPPEDVQTPNLPDKGETP